MREARKAKELSQTTVANVLGVSQATVSDWERDEYPPTVPALAALATLLNLDHGEALRLAGATKSALEATA